MTSLERTRPSLADQLRPSSGRSLDAQRGAFIVSCPYRAASLEQVPTQPDLVAGRQTAILGRSGELHSPAAGPRLRLTPPGQRRAVATPRRHAHEPSFFGEAARAPPDVLCPLPSPSSATTADRFELHRVLLVESLQPMNQPRDSARRKNMSGAQWFSTSSLPWATAVVGRGTTRADIAIRDFKAATFEAARRRGFAGRCSSHQYCRIAMATSLVFDGA